MEVAALDDGLADVHRRALAVPGGAEDLRGDEATEDDGGQDDELLHQGGQCRDDRGEQNQAAADGGEPDSPERNVQREPGDGGPLRRRGFGRAEGVAGDDPAVRQDNASAAPRKFVEESGRRAIEAEAAGTVQTFFGTANGEA